MDMLDRAREFLFRRYRMDSAGNHVMMASKDDIKALGVLLVEVYREGVSDSENGRAIL